LSFLLSVVLLQVVIQARDWSPEAHHWFRLAEEDFCCAKVSKVHLHRQPAPRRALGGQGRTTLDSGGERARRVRRPRQMSSPPCKPATWRRE